MRRYRSTYRFDKEEQMMKLEDLKTITAEAARLSESFPTMDISFENGSMFLRKEQCQFYVKISLGKHQDGTTGFLIGLNVPMNMRKPIPDTDRFETMVGELSLYNKFVPDADGTVATVSHLVADFAAEVSGFVTGLNVAAPKD
jgi:hypothetical protein